MVENKIYDSIIIGAGPAGIIAAIYLARRKLSILLIYEKFGGLPFEREQSGNYEGLKIISGEEFVKLLENYKKSFNINEVNEKISDIKKTNDLFEVKTNQNLYSAKTIIIATGTKPKMLNIPGEIDFLGKGVAYCATCDAPLFRNKEVAIVGQEDFALETTLQLEKYAKKIYLIVENKELKGEEILIKKIKSSSVIKIIYNSKIKEIKGERFVKSVIIKTENKTKEIPIQGIFIAIGYEANSDFIDIKKNNKNEIIVNNKNETSLSGLFAAGDVTDVFVKQSIVAAGEGAKAALAAAEYISKLKK